MSASASARPPAAVTVRPYDPPRDAPRHAELLTRLGPAVHTAAGVLDWERLRPAGAIHRALTAETPDARAVAFANVQRAPWSPPGHFAFECIVDPAHRRRGVGTLLLDALTAFARGQGATRLGADVRDHLAESLSFVQHRGFAIDRHVFESRLDLTTFDDAPFAGAVARAHAAGIVFRSLADYGDSDLARRKVYALNVACVRDVPGMEGPDRPWDEFRKIFDSHWYRPGGQILAVDPGNPRAPRHPSASPDPASPDPASPDVERDRFVALAALGYFTETNSVYHMHTGVDRAYRGRGLALATKLVALRCARAWGAAYARTNNDSQNAPILAVNRKLGYTPQPCYYKLLKPLTWVGWLGDAPGATSVAGAR